MPQKTGVRIFKVLKTNFWLFCLRNFFYKMGLILNFIKVVEKQMEKWPQIDLTILNIRNRFICFELFTQYLVNVLHLRSKDHMFIMYYLFKQIYDFVKSVTFDMAFIQFPLCNAALRLHENWPTLYLLTPNALFGCLKCV